MLSGPHRACIGSVELTAGPQGRLPHLAWTQDTVVLYKCSVQSAALSPLFSTTHSFLMSVGLSSHNWVPGVGAGFGVLVEFTPLSPPVDDAWQSPR